MPTFQGRNRLTQYINRRVTQSIFRGFDYADHNGRALNLYAVINIHETAEASLVTVAERIRHKFRGWFRRATKKMFGRSLPSFYAYSLENPGDAHPHCNFAVNVPPALIDEFETKLPQWVKRAQGICRPFDVSVQTVQVGTHKSVANYMVKGTDPMFIDHFYLRELYEKHGPQGAVYGKRAGLSQSLDKASRVKANFLKRRNKMSIPINRQRPLSEATGYADKDASVALP